MIFIDAVTGPCLKLKRGMRNLGDLRELGDPGGYIV